MRLASRTSASRAPTERGRRGIARMKAMNEQAPPPAIYEEPDDEDIVEAEGSDPIPQVSSLIAVSRIIAVLGMGLCVSFGLFIMLVGVKGVIIGIPIILLAIPCYYGMQVAERLATRETRRREAQGVDEP